MRQDLASERGHVVDEGRLVAPDGTVYHRRTTRMGRRDAATLVAHGRPVVVHWPGGGPGFDRVTWFDGADAQTLWSETRARVTREVLDLRRGEFVTAGRWESPDGAVLLLLTWHH